VSELNIYFTDDSDLAEYEAENKGYRTDVFVKVGHNLYSVKIYTMIRLQQDFESEIESYGFYKSEPNLVLVKESTKDEIIDVVKELYEQEYFDALKPTENIKIDQLIKVY